MIRSPVVAGLFYPDHPENLRHTLKQLLQSQAASGPAFGVIVPHAGYIYSGALAGGVFAQVEIPQRVILLGPNHTGAGAAIALDDSNAWRTPLGEVPLDADLAARLRAASPLLQADSLAHAHEHSLEVMLPFLQQLRPDVRIVPICIGHSKLRDWLQLGTALERVLRQEKLPVLLVASSDMSHYVPAEVAQRQDRLAIEKMLALDAEGLCRTVASHSISMCGYAPVTVLLAAAAARGGLKAQLVGYTHSGEISGDRERVVGYAGLAIR